MPPSSETVSTQTADDVSLSADDLAGMEIGDVRSDIDDFTDQRIGIDRSYLSWTHSFNPELHLAATAGYLEEMYAGAGGEIYPAVTPPPRARGRRGHGRV